MSDAANAEAAQSQPSTSKSKKNKKKKNNNNAKNKANGGEATPPVEHAPNKDRHLPNGTDKPSGDVSDVSEHEADDNETETSIPALVKSSPSISNGSAVVPPSAPPAAVNDAEDPKARFDAMVQDRDNLRAEVTQLRKSLEELQQKHEVDVGKLEQQLEESHSEKEHAESQYRNLLGKINTIKAQLGERLKADADELSQARAHIEDLEDRNGTLEKEVAAKTARLDDLEAELQAKSKEMSSLRNRSNLSQQNWENEREELLRQESYLRKQFEIASQEKHIWEVLASEEKSRRKIIEDRSTDLEEQAAYFKEAYEKTSNERDTQSLAVDGLQKALQEIQNARKAELRELVESTQREEETLRKKLEEAEKSATEAKKDIEAANLELERALPFEKEVKEKNLLIGKLRHEAVILNDHLTKALRFLKKGKPEDNVDRQIVTNHFLHFLALDRSDPKKFQVLQLIAALLNWNEEQREQAGLARPGTAGSSGSLRPPNSPFHRTPSTPTLSADYFSDSGPASKESLAELWQNFLEQEAQQGHSKSRSSSVVVPKIQQPRETSPKS